MLQMKIKEEQSQPLLEWSNAISDVPGVGVGGKSSGARRAKY